MGRLLFIFLRRKINSTWRHLFGSFRKLVRINSLGNSLVVQWLALCASTAGGMGLIPGQGTKIPHARGAARKKKKNKLS